MSDNAPREPSQRRLQRPPDFTGPELNHFSDVVLRHGLPGALLALLCLFHPDVRALLMNSMASAVSQPLMTVLACLTIFILLFTVAWFIDRGAKAETFDALKLVWVIYLLGISVWEELAFRLAIPAMLGAFEMDYRLAVLISNALFGLLHYFTLRWKWQWCLAAFLGGMALSRQFVETGDFALIVAIHWIATFINTPRYPGQNRAKS